ncbi:hypothetical protein AGR56_12105 [Clostridium sp. DMHC 10]|nr:hypothetical protein AGR56_12105 [Clostridium sp. DMHC 10]
MKQNATNDIAEPLAFSANAVALVKSVECVKIKPNPSNATPIINKNILVPKKYILRFYVSTL